jgi:hypothetical protein
MPLARESSVLAEIPQVLSGLLGVPAAHAANEGADDRADLVLQAGTHRFLIEYRASSDRAAVTMAATRIRRLTGRRRGRWIGTVVVPFMGETGARACREAGVSWFDLSGNADIRATGLHVHLEGKPNRFLRRGRPGNPLAPKGSRVARWLLMHPDGAFQQREIAKAAGVDEGLTSRVVRWLQERDLVAKVDRGAWRVKDPGTLLEAWREVYDFGRYRVIRGILGARSSDEVMQKLATELGRRRAGYAMTGLAGAWLLTRHATFRTVSLLLRESPPTSLLSDLGLLDEPRGANVWLVVPGDEAVFLGSRIESGFSCAHPLQVYLDLKGHAERASEAADELRRRFLTWKVSA